MHVTLNWHQVQYGLTWSNNHDRPWHEKSIRHRKPYPSIDFTAPSSEMDHQLPTRQTYVDFRGTRLKYRKLKQSVPQGGVLLNLHLRAFSNHQRFKLADDTKNTKRFPLRVAIESLAKTTNSKCAISVKMSPPLSPTPSPNQNSRHTA